MTTSPAHDADLLTKLHGFTSNAIAAGRRYAVQNRVSGVSFEPPTGLLSGQVTGTMQYKTTAKIIWEQDGSPACRVGICSCPVRQNCKHVVALVVAAELDPALRYFLLSDEPEEPEEPDPEPTYLQTLLSQARLSQAKGLRQGAPAAFGTQADERAPKWEAALRGLLPESANVRDIDAAPVALQFEVHRARQSFRGSGRERPGLVLHARPAVMGSRGKWIKTGISWNTLGYLAHGGQYDRAQIHWLQEFLKSHSRETYGYAPTSSGLSLNDFAGNNLWHLLKEARQIGIALVQAPDGHPIEVVAEDATVRLNVSRSGSEGLEVGAIVEAGGRPVPDGQFGGIGAPAHGLFFVEQDIRAGTQRNAKATDQANAVVRGKLVLAPLASDVNPAVLGFAMGGNAVHIPQADEDRFLTKFYPQLRRSAPVVSEDASVELPTAVPPTLSLLAAYGDDHLLRLHWEWHYRSEDRVTAQPLWPQPGDVAYRDDDAEAAILRSLNAPWRDVPQMAESANHSWGEPQLAASAVLSGLDTMTFTEEVLPRLREVPHVEVQTSGNIASYREVTEAPVVSISTTATDERDWFDLGIVITLEGEPVSFAAVFSALAAGHTRMLLPSGAHFSLDLPELHQLRELIDEARGLADSKDGQLRISRFQMGLWDELAQLGIVDQQAAQWRQAVKGLLEGSAEDFLPTPAGLNATLRPYQLEGFNWLHFLYTHELGGVLADDMGLGKTVQALALMVQAKAERTAGSDVAGSGGDDLQASGNGVPLKKPFLVVAPTSVVGNWASEAARFAPELKVAAVSETFAKSGVDSTEFFSGADVVITSYALFRIDFERYGEQSFAGLLLDEAQFVKNHQSKAYQCARKLNVPFKLAITGTPLENNLMELWTLTSIVAPGLFPSPKRFAEFYQKPIEKNGDAALLTRLRARVRPLMLRRTKEQVIKDLPAKQEQVLEVVLNPRHHKVYQTHLQRERAKILGLLKDVNKNRFTIFQSLTLLRQLSLDVTLVDDQLSGVRSSKLDVLFEQLEDVLKEGHRALIFSQFTGFLGKLRERLVEQGIEFAYLDGTTRNRPEVVESFKTGTAPLFLISLKAGGFGLNLTEADYVFLLDPWWNPASEAQAVDRTHRIGQKKNVMVYRMVAKDTIEEKVMALKAKKSRLFSDVMTGESLSSGALTAKDLAGLFAE